MQYKYTFEGMSDGFLYNRRLRENEKKQLVFPVAAYREFCRRKGIKWPFDESNETEPAALPAMVCESNAEIVPGVSVDDVREMCSRSKAFESVLKAVAKWQKIGLENPDRMNEEALVANLKKAAKIDNWGSHTGGELSPNTQKVPLINLILNTWKTGGRPKKE